MANLWLLSRTYQAKLDPQGGGGGVAQHRKDYGAQLSNS